MSKDATPITKEQALAMLPDGEQIHTFRQGGPALIGADWPRARILEEIERRQFELTGPTATGMGHGMGFWDEHGFVFVATRRGEGTMTPREYTTAECRQMFLDAVRQIVGHWDMVSGVDQTTRLNGVAFSILVMLDGCAASTPGWVLAPCPHPGDKKFHVDEGENWWPENHAVNVACDITGGLHELYYKAK